MDARTRELRRDNGYVSFYDEAVLDGKNPNEPETICTKQPYVQCTVGVKRACKQDRCCKLKGDCCGK